MIGPFLRPFIGASDSFAPLVFIDGALPTAINMRWPSHSSVYRRSALVFHARSSAGLISHRLLDAPLMSVDYSGRIIPCSSGSVFFFFFRTAELKPQAKKFTSERIFILM